MGKQYGILKRILNNLESSTLPTAEPSDSGKFAKVDENGEYVLGTGGGSSGGVLVHEVTEGYAVRLDKTYKEIADAGFCVLDVVDGNGLHTITPIGSFAFEEGYGGFVRFGATDYTCSAENDYPRFDSK